MTITRPLIITALYSAKNFAVETFTNCPETAKFAEVFTRERFPLCGTIIIHCFNTCTYSKREFIKESDPENIKFRMVFWLFIHVSACNTQDFRPHATLVILRQCPVRSVFHKSAIQICVCAFQYHEYSLVNFCFHVWKPPFIFLRTPL